MNYEELDRYIQSDATLSRHDSADILDHFQKKYNSIAMDNDIMFIFDHSRNFNERNHIIQIHPRNNGRVPQHIYHYIVMTYCYMGELVFKIDNKHIALSQGDMIIFDRHVPHAVKACTEQDMGVNIILSDHYFLKKTTHARSDEKLVEGFFMELMNQQKPHTHYLILHAQQDDLMRSCIRNILCEYADPGPGSPSIIDSCIQIILADAVRLKQIQSNMSENEYRQQAVIHDIVRYIQDNYRSGNLNELCEHFGYETSYASRLIKQQTGKNFKSLVNEERMKQAARILANQEMPIYMVSDLVGISNLTTFYKRFQEYSGMTPQQYRTRQL